MTTAPDITDCGRQLEALVAAACTELVLVAPFLKAPVLQRLTDHLPESVQLTVVTRWHPDEVACGVSDPQAWDVVRGRSGLRFLLCQSLHAKYYRSDESCLVGSANLTQRALGWCASPNLEILVKQRFERSGALAAFEHHLMAASVPASETIQRLVMEAAKSLAICPPAALEEMILNCGRTTALTSWLPESRDPAAVWRLYDGGKDSMPVTAADSAAIDLSYLNPPMGLTEDEFIAFVRAVLLQQPTVGGLDEFLAEPRRFGAVVDFLAGRGWDETHGRTLNTIWQTLMRWLLHFYPERYERTVPRHSEVFARRSR